MEILNNIDNSIFLFLNSLHHPLLDGWMYLISSKWVWVPMYMVILFICYERWQLKEQLFLIIGMFVVALILTDSACGTFIRNFIERPRPTNLDSGISHLVHTVNDYTGGRFGFPSCHAANSFMLATLCTILIRNKYLSIFLFLWATIHSYSRIYLGVHYLGDILAGGLVGSLIAFVMYGLFNYRGQLRTLQVYTKVHYIVYAGLLIIFFLFVLSVIFPIRSYHSMYHYF